MAAAPAEQPYSWVKTLDQKHVVAENQLIHLDDVQVDFAAVHEQIRPLNQSHALQRKESLESNKPTDPCRVVVIQQDPSGMSTLCAAAHTSLSFQARSSGYLEGSIPWPHFI